MLLSVKCEDYQPVHSVQGGAWLLTPLSCEPTLARVTSPVSTQRPVHSPGAQVPACSGFTLPCMVNRYKHCRFWLFPVQSLDCPSKIWKITQSWHRVRIAQHITAVLSPCMCFVVTCDVLQRSKMRTVAVDSNQLPLLTLNTEKPTQKLRMNEPTCAQIPAAQCQSTPSGIMLIDEEMVASCSYPFRTALPISWTTGWLVGTDDLWFALFIKSVKTWSII